MSKSQLLAIAGVLVVGLGLMLILPFMQNQLNDIGQTSDMTPVDLDLGASSFEIPKAYLWYKPNWAGKADDAIHMTVTLPDYLPYSEDTKILHKGGPGLKYKVAIDIFKKSTEENPEDVYFKEDYLKTCKKQWSLYKVCPYPPEPNLFEVLVQKNAATPLAFVCPRTGTQRSPFCKTELAFTPSVKLQIGLHETQLPYAQVIIKDVIELLRSFSK